jgi:hypothetical protein
LARRHKSRKKKKRSILIGCSKEPAMSSSVAGIAQWQNQVRVLLPSLSRSEAMVLGLLSYGIVMLDGCGLTRLNQGLAQLAVARYPSPHHDRTGGYFFKLINAILR